MMQLLEITQTKKRIIRYVCKAAQDSLLRIHDGKSVYSPKMSLVLRVLKLTEDEYLSYSSDAFYDFQRVRENPELISDMSKGFIHDFTKYALLLQKDLEKLYGPEVGVFIQELQGIHNIRLDYLNMN